MEYVEVSSRVKPGIPPLVDPFEGFFCNLDNWSAARNTLLDVGRARRLFKIVSWGAKNDVYTFQQPLACKSGPYVTHNGRRFAMISSYDYLGLIGHPDVEATAIEAIQKYGTGTGGVRLLTGTIDLHGRLEQELARFLGTEAALTFTSGYLANIGVIAALLAPDDLVILDARAHRSITDACRLARVPVRTFEHNNPVALERALKMGPSGRRTLIVVEGVYSMDGDVCPLPEIIELKKRFGAHLMIDEAHSFGTMGPAGRGITEHFGVNAAEIDLLMGSLSKAIPSNGGFLAGRRELMIYLQHAAAPFMFSAALCPAAAAAAFGALRILQKEPHRLKSLQANTDYLRNGLQDLGFDTGESASPIVPVIVGEDETAYWFARHLYDKGILASAVVFPAVAHGAARLRLCATARQSRAMLERVVSAFETVRDEFQRPA